MPNDVIPPVDGPSALQSTARPVIPRPSSLVIWRLVLDDGSYHGRATVRVVAVGPCPQLP